MSVLGTEVGVYAAHPGIVRTNLGRHLTMEKSWISSMVLGPLWWLTFRKASEGAQTPLYCAICSDIKNEQGKCYRSELLILTLYHAEIFLYEQ